MSIRNLHALFEPRSVAVVGASERDGSLGRIITENLLAGGFEGDVLAVNPKYRSLFDRPVFRDVDSLPNPPDLAVIVTPPCTVPGIIDALARRGTRGACVISAGLGSDREGNDRSLRQQMLDSARPHTLRIVGSNCLGIQVPRIGLNASFAHLMPSPGSIAFVAQSGAMITSILDWAEPRGIGFSHTVSLGDMADVDFGDMLDYLANDPKTRSILLYIEAVSHARKFMSAARAAARSKPVIVVKAGRHAAAARAAASHTGALAGSDAVYDAAFRRAGLLRVFSLEDLFVAVETLSSARPPGGGRLAILTNGGGIGVMATDALLDEGGQLADLSDQTLSALSDVLPATWSHGNPVDIIGDATGDRYGQSLAVLLQAPEVDAVLVLNCPTAVASSSDAADAVVAAYRAPPGKHPGKTLLTSWVGEHQARGARERLRENAIPTYQSPEDAAKAFAHMVRYRRNQSMLMETPPSLPELFDADASTAQGLVQQAVAEGRQWLSETEAKRVIAAYGIETVETHHAASAQEVERIALDLGRPLALKIISPDITHKSDVGGVLLNVAPDAARTSAAAMLVHVSEARPGARLQGFSVQPMVDRSNGCELIAGMVVDAQFGPVLLFGRGGTAVEIHEDRAIALAPINLKLAHEMMSDTDVYRLLTGYRNVPGADLDAIALTLVRLSQLVVDVAEIQELDINPLLANAQGVVALDARIRVAWADTTGPERLAIRPYPKELEEEIGLRDGTTVLLRPIVPEDEKPLQAAFARLTPQEVRYRFFVTLKLLGHVTAARFTQIDYERQMALVLTEHTVPGRAAIHGVVRIAEDPDRESAEFAIVIKRAMTGQGLGKLLMQRIIEYARRRGIGVLHGDVLADNTKMRGLCKALGFEVRSDPDDRSIVRVTLALDRESDPAG